MWQGTQYETDIIWYYSQFSDTGDWIYIFWVMMQFWDHIVNLVRCLILQDLTALSCILLPLVFRGASGSFIGSGRMLTIRWLTTGRSGILLITWNFILPNYQMTRNPGLRGRSPAPPFHALCEQMWCDSHAFYLLRACSYCFMINRVGDPHCVLVSQR